MEALIAKWRAEATKRHRQADDCDRERTGFTGKHYSDMSDRERARFDELARTAYELRTEANVYARCANEAAAAQKSESAGIDGGKDADSFKLNPTTPRA